MMKESLYPEGLHTMASPSSVRPSGYNPVELSRDWHGFCSIEND